MLRVTKILEGGIDLTTKEQLPRSIVIGNSSGKEVIVPVQEDIVQSIAAMIADDVSRDEVMTDEAKDRTKGVIPPRPRLEADLVVNTAPNVPADHINMEFRMPEDVAEEEVQAAEELLDDYSSPPPSDDGFEPGEEYDDVGTGVGSL